MYPKVLIKFCNVKLNQNFGVHLQWESGQYPLEQLRSHQRSIPGSLSQGATPLHLPDMFIFVCSVASAVEGFVWNVVIEEGSVGNVVVGVVVVAGAGVGVGRGGGIGPQLLTFVSQI